MVEIEVVVLVVCVCWVRVECVSSGGGDGLMCM